VTASSLVARALGGDRRALARLLTWTCSRRPEAAEALDRLDVRRRRGPGSPLVVGVTGPPGAGKSTLVDALVARSRALNRRAAVVAVDPSSPRSGGALLGDRLRMERHALDPSVFVRSVSSAGRLGGLALPVYDLVDIFDAVGFDEIFVETVGVGQSETGVLEVADVVALVLSPEAGDDVQVAKAGIHEVADLAVVNKADRAGADRLVRVLRAERPSRPALRTVASTGEGVEALGAEIEARHRALCGPMRAEWDRRRADGREAHWLEIVADAARRTALAQARAEDLAELRAGTLSPGRMAERGR
jgi:LAO/AO transport system kinase